MTTEGVDYAFTGQHPNPFGLAAAGKQFAMRYVGPGSDDKHLHADERDQLWAAGLDIVLLVEGTENSALGGFSTGQLHAKSAEAARTALGAPALPMYFAVDFDVTASQWSIVAAYLNGAATVIGAHRVGVYGGVRAVEWAARDGVAAWFFQTYAWSRDPNTGVIVWYPGNHVEQYRNGVAMAGGTVDLCRAITYQYGQWSKEGDMDPSNPDFQALIWRVHAMVNNLDEVAAGPTKGEKNMLAAKLAEIDAKLDGAAPVPPIVPGAVDLTDAAVHEVAEATAQELHDRLAQ